MTTRHQRFQRRLTSEILEGRQLLAETFSIGTLNQGIVGPDTYNGPGYIMFSQETVEQRFPSANIPATNSDNLLIVRAEEDVWQFFNNVEWIDFEPALNDRLLAAVDFKLTTLENQNDPEFIDVVTDLIGTDTTINGIAAGYVDGDLEFLPDTFGLGVGSFNNGEHKVLGTAFQIETDERLNGAGFSLETIATGLVLPIAFAVAPDGKIFVAEKKGRIKIVEDGEVTSTFLDITDEVASVGDRGLIGLALDPNFETNGHVYYQYTVLDPDGDGITPDEDGDGRVEGVGGAVERVTVSDIDPNVADMSTRVTVLDGHRMNASTHSVGDVDFDNDGNLIFTWGDGGFGDIRLEAQDPNSVQGKLFRIDPTTFEGVPDNPFYDASNPDSVASKVWALGIRNSWKLTVDRETGDVYMGEVTDRGPEEINVFRGDDSTTPNFGWPYYEGDNVKDSFADQVPDGFTYESPLIQIPHLDLGGGDAVTAGAVYRGSAYPNAFYGRYFFGDVVQGLLYSADQSGSFQQLGSQGDYLGVADIQMGPDEHLWMMSLFTGTISRLVYDAESAAIIPPTIAATQSRSAGEGSVTVEFDASDSISVGGGNLTYAWDFESDGIVDSTDPAVTTTFSTLGRTTTTLVVTDELEGGVAERFFETDVLAEPDVTNLALGRPTTQSQTAYGGLSSRAVDGDLTSTFGEDSVTLTIPTKNAYWEVDLEAIYDISSIDIFERTDPSGTPLEDFVVLISEQPFSSGNLEAVVTDPGVTVFPIDDITDSFTLTNDEQSLAQGQYVRIQSTKFSTDLALAEVRVFGQLAPQYLDIVGLNGTNEFWGGVSDGTQLNTSRFGALVEDVETVHVGSGDINNDGWDDMVVLTTEGELVVGLSTGFGSFVVETWGGLVSFVEWTEFHVADFNGDGFDDVLARAGSDGTFWLAASDGSSFSNHFWGRFMVEFDWTFAYGDYNGDGRYDVAGRAADGTWWTGVSSDTGMSNSYWGKWNRTLAWSDVSVGDFNGDGLDDIAGRANNAYWWVGTSTGSSFQSQYWATWTPTVDW